MRRTTKIYWSMSASAQQSPLDFSISREPSAGYLTLPRKAIVKALIAGQHVAVRMADAPRKEGELPVARARRMGMVSNLLRML